MKTCPFCAQEIAVDAARCRHCHKEQPDRALSPEEVELVRQRHDNLPKIVEAAKHLNGVHFQRAFGFLLLFSPVLTVVAIQSANFTFDANTTRFLVIVAGMLFVAGAIMMVASWVQEKALFREATALGFHESELRHIGHQVQRHESGSSFVGPSVKEKTSSARPN